MKKQFIQKQQQISQVKSFFSRQLEQQLGLIEVQAPILSRLGDGTQDNLSGTEKAVQVKVKTLMVRKFNRPLLGFLTMNRGDKDPHAMRSEAR